MIGMTVLLSLAACHDPTDGTPLEAVEICGDGIDNDGDGRSLNCPISEYDADLTVVGSDDDEAGRYLAFFDADGDGQTDLLVTLRDQLEDTYPPPSRIAMVPHQTSGSVNIADASWIGVAGLESSLSLRYAYWTDNVVDDMVYVHGGSTWLLRSPLSDQTEPVATWWLNIMANQVTADFNGDGVLDMAWGEMNRVKGSGNLIWVYLGPLSGDYTATGIKGAKESMTPEDYRIRGWGSDPLGDSCGYIPFVAGDVDGDGVQELGVVSPYAPCGLYDPDESYSETCGAVYVVNSLDSIDDDYTVNRADTIITVRESDGEANIRSATSAGDMNGDGVDDLLVMTGMGASVVLGPLAPGVQNLAEVRVGHLYASEGDEWGPWHFWYAGHGDFNGDGVVDVAVAKIMEDPTFGDEDQFQVNVCLGPFEGEVSTDQCEQAIVGQGLMDFYFSGLDLFSGDLDGDGLDDLAIGISQTLTPYGDDPPDILGGVVFVFLGASMFGDG